MTDRAAVLTWLFEGDPAIRWQVMRDLTDEPDEVVAAERHRVAFVGWGAELLDRQTPDGHWGDDQKHGWMTTNDALALLKDLGADPVSEPVRKAIGLVRDRVFWHQLDGRPFFDGETEACINGRILASGACFGEPSDRLAERLIGEQLEDGGWNCEAPPSTRSSFHSTICVLEGLLQYEKTQGATVAVTDARARGENYLLERRMMRSFSSGNFINQNWLYFSFPVVWRYDVLRGLDYLRNAGVKPDDRVAEAVQVVQRQRRLDGRWSLDGIHADHKDRLAFDVETGVGEASRWNTLRALRVLEWCGKSAA